MIPFYNSRNCFPNNLITMSPREEFQTDRVARREELLEPLLTDDPENVEDSICLEEQGSNCNDVVENSSSCPDEEEFSIRKELSEMVSLGFPLAVSFFCRMGMASTDSSFVGHINDGEHTAETFLAAAVLSDMCVSIFISPPLAFNQVLNALVGQAMGSGNPQMAGIWLQQSVFWLTVSMLPCLVGFFYAEPFLIALGFPATVAHVAGIYTKYNIFWPIPNGLYQCMRFYFQAQGLAKPAMYNNIMFLFINALLNWLFVFGGPLRYITGWKGLGFIGAAISLSISRTMQSIVYFFYMFVYKKHHKATWPEAGMSFQHHTRERTIEFMKQSLPNIGTLVFQICAGQATTVLVGRLGERAIAASSALSTVTIPWSGTLSATCSTISGVRVGYHLGRGNGHAAKQSAWLVMHFITISILIVALLFVPLKHYILDIATDDTNVLSLSATLVPAMLIGTYLNLIVSNITSGVFGGMGRPLIATILSFGFELPLSIGGVAIYILVFHGNLLGVYWWQAISGGLEMLVVLAILLASNWDHWADEARRRQEASSSSSSSSPLSQAEEDNQTGELVTAAASTTTTSEETENRAAVGRGSEHGPDAELGGQ